MPLTPGEMERLRLILSTFQDGSGWEKRGTRFGFRQFERALADVLSGQADENKALFDVVADREVAPKITRRIGFSCKLKAELRASSKHVYIEVSNAVSQFSKHLKSLGLPDVNAYKANPSATGAGILAWIGLLHAGDAKARSISLPESTYLVLLYDDASNDFELFEIPIDVFLSDTIDWSTADSHLVGKIGTTTVIDYYWNAGQLKFYVPLDRVTWRSEAFRLEPLPSGAKTLLARAEEMFPGAWATANKLP